MGLCCSNASKKDTEYDSIGKGNDDSNVLVRSDNPSTSALSRANVPAPPLLKEINFAAIADNIEDEEDTDDAQNIDGADSVDSDEINKLIEEEDEDDSN